MLPLLSWCMGDVSRISFWSDKWLDVGPIVMAIGENFIKRSGIRQDISMREFYSSDIWSNFTSNGEDRVVRKLRPLLQYLLNFIPPQVELKEGEDDTLLWKPNRLGCFSTRLAWEAIRSDHLQSTSIA